MSIPLCYNRSRQERTAATRVLKTMLACVLDRPNRSVSCGARLVVVVSVLDVNLGRPSSLKRHERPFVVRVDGLSQCDRLGLRLLPEVDGLLDRLLHGGARGVLLEAATFWISSFLKFAVIERMPSRR